MAAAVLATSLIAAGCGSSSSTGTGGSTTTSRSGSTSTTAPSATPTDTLVWPFAKDSIRYNGPAEAAKGFAVKYLGFVAPVVGAFIGGDSRSGEVSVRANATGPETTVMVRKLAPDDTWWVLGASTPNLQLQSPAWNASLASPVTLSGQSTAFEATVNVEIRQDDTLTPLATDIVMGGSNGQMGPFSKAITFAKPTATRGAIVLQTFSSKDGNVVEASVVRVRFSGI
jgi:hypothetical protein